MKSDKKQLTRGETQVMNILWGLPDCKGHSADIMEAHPEPKPALTTLLTFLTILKNKGFVKSSKRKGSPTVFVAKVSKEEYTSQFLDNVKNTFFGGSFTSLISCFAKPENLSQEDIKQLKDLVNKL